MNTAEIRHNLHDHPGISGDECFAHDLIVRELSACGAVRVYEHVGGFGVVAVWGEGQSLPTIALRADIDALPIGHRCGHDGHTAILLEVAKWLGTNGCPEGRNIILVFQPEEETGLGSQKIIDAGILQQYNIKGFYGLHNLPGFPLGTVVLNNRTFAAASTGVIYRLEGRNTHASTPEKGINPGLAVAEIIQRFAQLNSRPNATDDSFRQSTLICVNLGQEAFGTSAGDAEIMFTLRAFTNNAMGQLVSAANDIVSQTAGRYQLQTAHTFVEPFLATENQFQHVEHIEEYCGCRSQHVLAPFRWSEDFANYLLHFPGAFFGMGAGERHVELHHPDYDFPDQLIPLAAQVFVNLITAPICNIR